MAEQLFTGLLFAVIISVSSFLVRFLTLSGAVAQFILGTILLGLGGWQWTVPMLVFFFLSSLISKIGKQRREKAELFFEKTARRDAWQVIANGGVAGAITLLWFFTRNELLYVAYLGSIAAATADTLGTEIGTLSRSSPILITTFKRVEAGRSGGVTALGLVAGIAGSFTIWLSSLSWFSSSEYHLLLLATLIGGLAGELADSFVGATWQAQFQCAICGKLMERLTHCERGTSLVSGKIWIKNDQVNLICTIIGAILSLSLLTILR